MSPTHQAKKRLIVGILRKLQRRLQQVSKFLRIWSLNCNPGIEISHSVTLHPSSIIDLSGDGFIDPRDNILQVQPGTNISVGALISPYGGKIEIGKNVFIGAYTAIYGHGGVKIGNDVLIAGHCTIIPANHTFDDPENSVSMQSTKKLGIEIHDSTWIGSGVRILDGVVIGHGCVIGAGAVVTKSIAPMSVAVGVPARIIASR